MKIIHATPKRLEYRNPYMQISHTKADFGSFTKEYFVIELGPRAGVVAVRDDRVLLTRQYRYLIDTMSWEIPGGKIDSGESPADAAIRECLEETGVRCFNLKLLVVYYPGLDNFNNRTTLFYSEGIDETAQFVPDETEVTEIAWMPLGKCLDMVFKGEILDALTVSGLLAYQIRVLGAGSR
jgi:8-oxo-dGTP pyrophosphatase MutT (NUDIX family)